jgi:hypothetical protein
VTKHILTSLLLTGLTTTAIAQNAPWDRKVDATVQMDMTGKSANDYELNVRGRAIVKFNMVLAKGLELYAKIKATQLLVKDGESQDLTRLEIAQIVEDLSVRYELGEALGTTRVVMIAGKQRMAFGQRIDQLAIPEDSLLYGNGVAENKYKIGLTFLVPVNVLDVIEQVALSVYENGADDFDIADEKGLSVKVTAKITKELKAQMSAMTQETAGSSDNEKRYSLGLVYSNTEGGYEIWAQGIKFKNNPAHPNSEYAAQVGASMKVSAGTVVVDYQLIDNNAKELGLAYKFQVGKYLMFGPEVRKTWVSGGADTTTLGLRAAAKVSHESARREKRGTSK